VPGASSAMSGMALGAAGDVRDVMFRFGSWCYSGQVQIGQLLSLADVPSLIPRLRMQQNILVSVGVYAWHDILQEVIEFS